MIVMSFCNIKGGVAKTTSVLDIAYALTRLGKRVVIVDMDPQANLTYAASGLISDQTPKTLYECLIPMEPRPLHEILVKTKQENVFLASGTLALSSADLELSGRTGREWILQRVIEAFADFCHEQQVRIDYLLIDTPPTLGLLSVNSLVASGSKQPYQAETSGFIIPVPADVFATIGISHLKKTIGQLRANLRIPIPFIGAVATRVDRTNESRNFLQIIRDEFGDQLFQTYIPDNVRVKEANNVRVLYDHAPESAGAQAYMNLTKEIISRVEAV